MKTLLTIFVSTFIALNANASLGIKSIELNDSSLINGAEISAITLNNTDSSVESVETSAGEVVKGLEIKRINMFKAKAGTGFGFSLMAARGGTDSGD